MHLIFLNCCGLLTIADARRFGKPLGVFMFIFVCMIFTPIVAE
jgi:hypothetical protein